MTKRADKFTGKDLAAMLERLALSRVQLHKLTGIHRNTAGRWIDGDLPLPLKARMALAALEAGLSPVTRAAPPPAPAKPRR